MDKTFNILDVATKVAEDLLAKKDEAVVAVESFELDPLASNIEEDLKHEVGLSEDPSVAAAFESQEWRIEAITKAAAAAIEPTKFVSGVAKSIKEFAQKTSPLNLSQGDLSVAVEGFSGEYVGAAVKYTAAYAAFSGIQDPAIDALFPILPIDPTSGGFSIEVPVKFIEKDYRRTGVISKDDVRVPVFKVYMDPTILNTDDNRIVPVMRETEDDANFFVTDLAKTTEYRGETVKTAPLKTGVDLPLVTLSQTSQELQNGGLTRATGLDPKVKVTTIVYQLTGTDSNGNEVTESFGLDVRNSQISFSPTLRGDITELKLALDGKKAYVRISSDVKTYLGNDSQIFANLPAGYKVELELSVTGTGDATYGNIKVYVNELKAVRVYDPSGQLVSESDENYTKIMDVFNTIKPLGVELEAYRNIVSGQPENKVFTATKVAYIQAVPYRTLGKVQLPLVDDGPNGDLHLLGSISGFTNVKMSQAGYEKLEEFVALIINDPEQAIQVNDYVKYMVIPKVANEALDLPEIVDSLDTTKRVEAVRKALVTYIERQAITLFTESGYRYSFHEYFPGQKPKLVVAVGSDISQFVPAETVRGNNFDMEFVVSSLPNMNGKIYFAFRVPENGKQDFKHLSFGYCMWSPDLVIPVQKVNVNDEAMMESRVFPRFEHVVLVPVIGYISVTGINEVLKKLPLYTRAV